MRARHASSAASPAPASSARARRDPRAGGRERRHASASRRRRWAGPGLAVAVALLLFGGGRLAPVPVEAAPPDFSGTWTYEPPGPEATADELRASARPPTGPCAARCAIVQSEGTITVTRLRPGDAPMTLRADGIERQRLQHHPVSRQEFEAATRTVWEGATLAIYSKTEAPQPGQVRTTLALVDGRLVIESAIDLNGRRTVHRFTYRRVEN